MSGHAKKIKVIGAIAFALWILYVLVVAEDAYDLNLDFRLEIGVCLFACLLYFLVLVPLFRAKSDLAKVFTVILAIVGCIGLFAFVLFAFILNPWFWAALLSPFFAFLHFLGRIA